MTGYVKIPLNLLIEEVGEDNAKQILSDFSCPLNKDVDKFLRLKAIEFEKQSFSRTKLVYASYRGKMVLVAYYTLAMKSFNITRSSLSKTLKRKITKYATYDPVIKTYITPAPLIAQLGKNFSNGYNKLISGDELLKIACDDIQTFHSNFGGKIAYLECEDRPQLLDFYNRNGFVAFHKRMLDSDETNIDGKYLIQMLKVFKR